MDSYPEGRSPSLAQLLKILEAAPSAPGCLGGLPVLCPVHFTAQCDAAGVAVACWISNAYAPDASWRDIMHREAHGSDGAMAGCPVIRHFNKGLCTAFEVPHVAQTTVAVESMPPRALFRQQFAAVLKNWIKGDFRPASLRNVLYHANDATRFMLVTIFPILVQVSSGLADEEARAVIPGWDTMRQHLQPGEIRMTFVVHSEPDLDWTDPRVTLGALQDHVALKYVQALVLTCSHDGTVLHQNNAALTKLGVLGQEIHVHGTCLGMLGQPTPPINYMEELMGSKDWEVAQQAVNGGGTHHRRLRIRSPTLLQLMQLPAHAVVWYDVYITATRSRGDNFREHVNNYVVAQVDVTATVIAEERVRKVKRQQRGLLQQILPPQVVDTLLEEPQRRPCTDESAANSEPGSHPPDRASSSGLGQGFASLMRACTPPVQDSAPGYAQLHAAPGDTPGPHGLSRLSMSTDSSELQLTNNDVQRLATFHPVVSILFTDIEGFTSMSQELHPAQVMLFLNHLFSQFDDLLEVHDVYKVETIGDCYMVCAGLFQRGSPSDAPMLESLQKSSGEGQATPDSPKSSTDDSCTDILGGHDPEHGPKLLRFAKAMMSVASTVITPLGQPVRMRVGLHTGSIMTGVVGRKMPRFCCFGDTVNTASRMESTGRPGYIHASAAFRDQTPDEAWVATGGVEVKGKGHMDTYLLEHTPAWSGLPEE